jgi:hypothetical protein
MSDVSTGRPTIDATAPELVARTDLDAVGCPACGIDAPEVPSEPAAYYCLVCDEQFHAADADTPADGDH